MLDVFRYAFRPIYQQAGIPWRPSPLWKSVPSIILALCLVAVVPLSNSLMTAQSGEETGDSYRNPAQAPLINPPRVPQVIGGLQITTAGIPQRVDTKIDPQIMQNFEGYLCQDGPVQISITRVDYKPDLMITLDGAVQGYLRAVANANGVTDFQSNTVQSRIDRYRAIRSYASFTERGTATISKGVYFVVGQTLWAVQASVFINDDDGTADRIIDSVTVATP